MKVLVIDYGSGNLRSAAKALERAARECGLPAEVVVTGEAAAVADADRLLLPGVGAFGDCREGLLARPGLWEALVDFAIERQRPFLGICVGMQLMATRGLEHGNHPGFDWIPGEVVPIEPDLPNAKIPHMGWNELAIESPGHPLLAGIESGDHAYFVHSYHLRPAARDNRLATVDYGGPVTAVVGRDNLVGTQFHPEKSQAAGLRFLANFLKWQP